MLSIQTLTVAMKATSCVGWQDDRIYEVCATLAAAADSCPALLCRPSIGDAVMMADVCNYLGAE